MSVKSIIRKVQASTQEDRILIDRLFDTDPDVRNLISSAVKRKRVNLQDFYDAVLASRLAPESLAGLAPKDPLAAARLKGMKVKQELLYADGKPLGSEAVAELLGISRQAVSKRKNKAQLLAVSLGKRGYSYPIWQFKDGGVITGLDRVLAALSEFDNWTQLMFMKTGDIRLENRTPLECLIAGDIDRVILAAACYGKQIAA